MRINKETGILLVLFILAAGAGVFLFVSSLRNIVPYPGSDRDNRPDARISRTADKGTKSSSMLLAITPHHQVAEKMIEDLFRAIGSKKYERVIVISPNHFNKGTGYIQTTDGIKKAGAGEVTMDHMFVKELKQAGIAVVEGPSFSEEHGINNLTPYVTKYFPNAQIVPLLIGEQVDKKKIGNLAAFIDKKSKERDTVVILSADFSHYLTGPAAQLHDNYAKRIISAVDETMASRLDIDCPSGLMAILRLARSNKLNFSLVNNSNAALLAKDPYAVEPTSYITGYFSSRNPKKIFGSEASLLFFGDMMLDRDIRTAIDKKGIEPFFRNSERLFLGSDSNIANLEGPVAEYPSVSQGSKEGEPRHMKFVFSPKTLPFWKQNGFNMMYLGNNHIMNFGKDGLEQTKANLSSQQIQYFGAPGEGPDHLIYDTGAAKVGLVAYNQFHLPDAERTTNQIKELKRITDLVLVYAHWGEEYVREPNQRQTDLAHRFIDAGADGVIGSHPHVTQTIEKYHEKYIFYSLGNFVFDQFFSRETKEGLAVGIELDKDEHSLRYYLVPVRMEPKMLFEIERGSEMKRRLEELAEMSPFAEHEKQEIRNGIID